MIRKAKSIEQIYEECKDFDLVITNDAPLATALNKLVEKSRLEYFAMTPKQIASKFAQLYFDNIYEKYEIVIMISRARKLPLKNVHQSVRRIYEMWMYNAKIENITQYLSTDENLLLEDIQKYKTIETAMDEFNEEFYKDKSIAVVGEDLFSLLDLEVLPKRGKPAAAIDIFEEGEFIIDKTYVFSSGESLISNVLELITKENADECAIVTDKDSEYLEILKTRLKQSGIPVEIRKYLSEDVGVRQFVSFLEYSFRIRDLKVGDFILMASPFAVSVNSKYSNYELSNFISVVNKNNSVTGLYELSNAITELSYRRLFEKLQKEWSMNYDEELIEIFKLLGTLDEKITEENFLEFKYFLSEFDAELDSEREGVLFVNSTNSSFIDRRIIFYLGMDNSWMRLYPDKDYLNKEEEEEKDRMRFEILIQQGTHGFYFVRDVISYKTVIPCYYFSMMSGKSLQDFNDPYFKPEKVSIEKINEVYPERKEKLPPAETGIVKSISPSSLNSFYKCPKYYSFKLNLPVEDNPALKKGVQLHEFAEFYFHHPEFVEENLQKIIEHMTDEMSKFNHISNRKFQRSEAIIGINNVKQFIDYKKDFVKEKLDAEAEGNELMKKFDKKKIYSNTEKFLDNADVTMFKGKMDLYHDKTIIDFKTGKTRKTEFEATLQSNVEYIEFMEKEDFDFQAAAYISSLRHKFPDEKLFFVYNFVLNNYKKVISPENIFSNVNTITLIEYIPMTFREYIISDEFFVKLKAILIKDKPNRLWNHFDYSDYVKVVTNEDIQYIDYFDEDKITDVIRKGFVRLMDEKGLTPKTAFNRKSFDTVYENEIDPIISPIFNSRKGKAQTGLIFKDDIDAFIEFTKERLAELNEYRNSKYPFKPVFDSIDVCKKCDYLNICIGNKLW